jgi:hypothetical protein
VLERPRWECETLLNFPIEILSERTLRRPPGRGSTPTPTAGLLVDKLLDVKRHFSSIADQYGEEVLNEFTRQEWVPIGSTVEVIDKAFHGFRTLIDGIRARTGIE